MKKIIRHFLKIFGVIFLNFLVIILLVLTLKGVNGNPQPEKIYNELRSESQPFEVSPERGRFALTQSIVEDKSYYFSSEIAKYVVPDLAYSNGHYVSLFAPGVSFIAIPFYQLGKNFGLSQVATFSVSSIFALANLILIFFIVKKITGKTFAGLIAGLTFLFGTVAWTYAVTFYQHHVTTFLLLWGLLLVLGKPNWFKTIILGFILGISIFVEYINAIFFIPILLFLTWQHLSFEELGRKIRVSFKFSLLTIFIGFLIGLVPIFAYNRDAYGDPFQLAGTLKSVRSINEETGEPKFEAKSYSEKGIVDLFKYEAAPRGADVLISSQDRGMAVYNPVILLGLLGIPVLLRKKKAVALVILGTILAILGLYTIWGDPWGGWAFGPRYMIPLMAFLAIFLGVSLERYAKNIFFIFSFLVLAFYSVGVSLAGTLTTHQIPPSVETDSARNLPKLMYLHNFDLIKKGVSGSFIFNNYLKSLISLETFFYSLLVATYSLIVVNFIGLFLSKKGADRNV